MEKNTTQENHTLENKSNAENVSVNSNKGVTLTPPPLFPSPVPLQKKQNKELKEDKEEEHQSTSEKVFSDDGLEVNTLQKKSRSLVPPPVSFNSPSTENESNSPLPETLQLKLENYFETDFSDVNIHQNSSSADDVNALAYTQGNDIHFAQGQFNPDSKAGQELIGHEFSHVVQQKNNRVQPTMQLKGKLINDEATLEQEADADGRNIAGMSDALLSASIQKKGKSGAGNIVQRQMVLDRTRQEGDFVPAISNGATEEAILADTVELLRGRTHHFNKIFLMTQGGLKIYNLTGGSPIRTIPLRGRAMLPDGVFGFTGNRLTMAGMQGGNFVDISVTLDITVFDEERQRVIRDRGTASGSTAESPVFRISLTDYVNADESQIFEGATPPVVMVVKQLPSGNGGSGGNSLQPWATSQATGVNNILSGRRTQQTMSRNTTQDRGTPDRVVPWVRPDGQQFVNVHVGDMHQALVLVEGQTTEELLQRIQNSTQALRDRQQQRVVDNERSIITDDAFLGGTGGDSQQRANAPAYPATLTGPSIMVRSGTGTFNMSLNYASQGGGSLLGQAAEAFGGAEFMWELINVTPLYQRMIRERAAQAAGRQATPTPAQRALSLTARTRRTDSRTEAGRFAASGRDLDRRLEDLREDERNAQYDLMHPLETSDGSASEVLGGVLVNYFNLQTQNLHSIMSMGGWVVSSLPSIFVLNQDYEREIPFPADDGYYMVRCVAQPRPRGRDGEVIHAPSFATKIIQVKDLAAQTRSELNDIGATLESSIREMLMSYRNTTDSRQRENLEGQLSLRVQEAAQTDRTLLQELIRNREGELRTATDDGIRTTINRELEILRTGTTESAGLIANLLTRQISNLETERNRTAETDPRRRRIDGDLEKMRNRLGTAVAREREMTNIFRPNAVFVNEVDGQTVPLLIEIGRVSQSVTRGVYTYRISDVTSPSGENYEQEGRTVEEAIFNCFREYAGHFPYGRGQMSVIIPPHAGIRLRQNMYRCSPRGSAQASERLDELIQVLTILGLFVPGVGVAVGAAGAIVSAARLANRVMNHTFQWDLEAINDMVGILGAVASGVSHLANARLVRTSTMFAMVSEDADVVRIISRMSTAARIAGVADDVFNWGGYFLGQMSTVIEFRDIQQDEASGNISHAEARRRRARLIGRAISDNVIQHAGPHIEHPQEQTHDAPPPQIEDGPYRLNAPEHPTPNGGDTPNPPHHGDTPNPHREEPPAAHHQDPPALPHHEPPRVGETPPAHETPPTHEPPNPHAGHTPESGSPQSHGTPEQRTIAFLNNREKLLRLIAGDHATIRELLNTHGNWRDLIMFLQTQGNAAEGIIQNIGDFRNTIKQTLDEHFGLRLSDKNASTEPSSDIDLASSGVDAGDKLIRGERYMRETYGERWRDLLRMNFYTEGERLFIYERVQSIMSERAFGELQQDVTRRSEVLNFAKMLEHAGSDAAARQRIEQLMTASGMSPAQINEARTLHTSETRAHELHVQLDGLARQFEAIHTANESDPRLIDLARQITLLQMEANFHTQEAYIAPGAARQAVRGVATHGHESYQSMLANLEMIEHVLHQAHGDVGAAVQEYEMYKYINRFVIAMTTGGISPDAFMLHYLQVSHDLYRNDRTQLQGVGAHDLSYLRAMHNQFVLHAQELLPQMRQRAMDNSAAWNAQHDSLQVPRRGDMTHIGDSSQPHTTVGNQVPPPRTPEQINALHAALPPDLRGRVPIVENPSLAEHTVHVSYDDGVLRIEVGPNATHTHIQQHAQTARYLMMYQGVVGTIRQFTDRILTWLRIQPGYGTAGFEARLEVVKLNEILTDLRAKKTEIENRTARLNEDLSLGDTRTEFDAINREIASIQAQLDVHETHINDFTQGRGFVAAESPSQPVSEAARAESNQWERTATEYDETATRLRAQSEEQTRLGNTEEANRLLQEANRHARDAEQARAEAQTARGGREGLSGIQLRERDQLTARQTELRPLLDSRRASLDRKQVELRNAQANLEQKRLAARQLGLDRRTPGSPINRMTERQFAERTAQVERDYNDAETRVRQKQAQLNSARTEYNATQREFQNNLRALDDLANLERGLSQGDTRAKGIFGEAKADEHMIAQGYEHIGGHGDQPQGIDGIYRRGTPPNVEYVVVEAKYGTSQLDTTNDGLQLSRNWCDRRLEQALRGNGRSDAEVAAIISAMRTNGYRRLLLRYEPSTRRIIPTYVQ